MTQMPKDYKHNCPCPHHPFECFGHPTTCLCGRMKQQYDCQLCRGAGFVTYRDGIAYETHDVEREEHLIEDCPECHPAAVQPS